MKLINPFGPKIAVLKIPKNLINKINNIGVELKEQCQTIDEGLYQDYIFNSDAISSNSSGNQSENDEMNILRKFQRKLREKPEDNPAVEPN